MVPALEHSISILLIQKINQLVINIGLKKRNLANTVKDSLSKHILFQIVILRKVKMKLFFLLISYILLTGLCDAWPVGVYNITARICNGICGSHHPHSSIYDSQFGSFEITKKQ
jgi:hypothetical protein